MGGWGPRAQLMRAREVQAWFWGRGSCIHEKKEGAYSLGRSSVSRGGPPCPVGDGRPFPPSGSVRDPPSTAWPYICQVPCNGVFILSSWAPLAWLLGALTSCRQERKQPHATSHWPGPLKGHFLPISPSASWSSDVVTRGIHSAKMASSWALLLASTATRGHPGLPALRREQGEE